MSVSKAGRIVIGATAAVLAAVGVAALAGTGRLHKEDPKLPVNLNETLTNEMSDTSSLLGFDLKVRQYLNLWGLQGASLSIMRNDSLLFAKGYGWADTKKKMQPGNILRMASVSKLVTAAGIMVLQERGELSLSSTVFGPDGILDDSLYNAAIADPLYYKITVEDLLRHKAGFSKKGGDPMFSTRWIMMQNHWKTVPTQEQLMVVQLKRPLKFEPGTWQDYSNFGYLALSMVIEKVSGMTYEEFIQKNVLHPAGCYGFRIGGNYYKDKYPEEVRYYCQNQRQEGHKMLRRQQRGRSFGCRSMGGIDP